MASTTTTIRSDKPVVLLTLVGVLALSLFLQHEFATRQALLFLVGLGLGITLLHAAFGFSGSWRNFIRKRQGAGVRAHILLLALTSLLFFPLLGKVFPNLHSAGALGPVSVSVFTGAFLFGIGMQLGGGCGSGTLYTVGGGHVRMLITLAFFIAGALIGTAHLQWWLGLPNLGKVSLIETLGWAPALAGQIAVLAALYWLVRQLEYRRRGRLADLGSEVPRAGFVERLIFGPWPLWWGVVGLAALNLLTLLIAGHPWTITFAFALWGAKIWNALGGDVASWSFWSSGYQAQALQQSVLADTTSLMDFGVILGAVLAAALAGRFAPDAKWKRFDVLTAVAGGLLMGYGARLAFGCNIGGMLAGIVSGSLHGWLWLLAGFAGAVVGVRLRILLKLDPPVGKHNDSA
jgi:uncharacterized membrane protein YedE/YeeE